MAKTPFYKIIVQKNGRDISDLVTRIAYEDAVDADNILTMTMSKGAIDIIDDPDFKEGSVFTLSFGYLGGKVSRNYYVRVSDILPSYESIVHLTIRCTDIGTVMKKGDSKKVWNNIRSSDIAAAIANRHGLIPVVEKTDTVYDSMPQGGKSDYAFLKYLGSIEKHGSFRFYLRNNELHFTRQKLEKKSFKVFTWNHADGVVKSFKPFSEETMKQASARDTVVTTVDPFTNQAKLNVINSTNTKEDPKLGDYEYHYNFNADQVSKPVKPNSNKDYSYNLITANKSYFEKQQLEQDSQKAGQHVNNVSGDPVEGFNQGSKIKKSKALKDYKATLTVEGDPDYEADTIITMKGVAKKDLGNWYVRRVMFTITPEGSFEVRFTLDKNAGKKTIDPKAGLQKDVNKTVGVDSDGTKKKELSPHYYDANGKEIFVDRERSFNLITNNQEFFGQ